MKVTVTPEGVVTLEVTNGDGQVALDMIRALQAESKSPPKPKAKARRKTRRSVKADIAPSLFAALKWLANNDSDQGLTAVDLANEAGITNGAAGQRIQKLVKAGYVYRVSVGHYRAVKPTE